MTDEDLSEDPEVFSVFSERLLETVFIFSRLHICSVHLCKKNKHLAGVQK